MGNAEALMARLRDGGEHRLASFTSEELVAVGADSPLQGLVLSERLAAMGPIPLTAALSAALRGLIARGFVHPEGAATAPGGAPRSDRHLQQVLDALGGEPGPGGPNAPETVSVPLSGDLAVVVALRRAPALVALVSEPSRTDLALRGPLAHRRTDAILHGFTDERGGLTGFLEERRSALGIHSFVLRGLDQETRSLCAALEQRAHEPSGEAPAGPCEVELEVAVPDESGRTATRLLVGLEPGPEGDRATISSPHGPKMPASEQVATAYLPRRLAELLEGIWRGDGVGIARVSAS